MLFLIIFTLCLSVLVVLVLKYFKQRYWINRNVVQDKEVFIEFLLGNISLSEIYKGIYDKYPNEPHIGIYSLYRPMLLVKNLQNIQTILTTEFESFHSRGIQSNENDILSDNILSITDYNRWKLIRQKISPIFTSSKIKNMSHIVERTAKDFVEMLKENKDMRDKPYDALYTYTTASIGASIFGIGTNVKNSMNSPFLHMTLKALRPSFAANATVLITSISLTLSKLLNLKVFGDHEKFFIGFVKKVLASRRNENVAVHDFIDLCARLQKAGVMKDTNTGYEIEPTDEVLAAQAFFFFIAGVDTSATTMHFTLLELSNNPKILKKVHEEIDRICTSENVDYETIEKLDYLDMVVNEAMRKFPPIGILQRECTKDTILPVGNIKIEKGVFVTIPVYAIHRDEKYYPNPEVFDPERFAPGRASQLPNYCYLPFGEGKRICMGARFAKVQVKAGLACLLRVFTLKEQNYSSKYFEKSFFAVKDADAFYELISRDSK